MTDDSHGRRRSRRRATARQGPPPGAPPVDESSEGEPPVNETPVDETPLVRAAPEPVVSRTPRQGRPRQPRPRGDRAAAANPRSDRDLAGPGASQLGPTGAMRARDLNRPTPEDLAEAEAELAIVRRHWTPAGAEPQPEAPPPYRAPRRRR